MKTKNQSTRKSKGDESSRQAPGEGKSDPSSDCSREQLIAEAAYFLAERRGFAPGYEVADWLQAEADMGHLF